MAFHGWMKGQNKPDALATFKNLPPTAKHMLAGYMVKANDVPALFSPMFWECVGLWKRYKLLGMPYDGGWAQNPAHLVRIIEIMENAYQTFQHQQMTESSRMPSKPRVRMRPTQ